MATSLGIISRTPKHYFFAQGGDPSGEALIAMEAPLNKKASKRQKGFGVEWQRLAKFLLNISGNKDVKKSQIVPIWEPIETVQPLTAANIIKTETDAGIPLNTSARRRGWSNEEIKQMEDDKKKEKKEMAGLAQNALDELRAQDARNNATGQLAGAAPANGRNNTSAQQGNGS